MISRRPITFLQNGGFEQLKDNVNQIHIFSSENGEINFLSLLSLARLLEFQKLSEYLKFISARSFSFYKQIISKIFHHKIGFHNFSNVPPFRIYFSHIDFF